MKGARARRRACQRRPPGDRQQREGWRALRPTRTRTVQPYRPLCRRGGGQCCQRHCWHSSRGIRGQGGSGGSELVLLPLPSITAAARDTLLSGVEYTPPTSHYRQYTPIVTNIQLRRRAATLPPLCVVSRTPACLCGQAVPPRRIFLHRIRAATPHQLLFKGRLLRLSKPVKVETQNTAAAAVRRQ